jgi:hypothetical protein
MVGRWSGYLRTCPWIRESAFLCGQTDLNVDGVIKYRVCPSFDCQIALCLLGFISNFMVYQTP